MPTIVYDGPKLRFSVTREYVWEMGHALAKHKGKCFSPHGHNYRAEIEFSGPLNRESGMVVDFAELDKKIEPYLKERYDHKFLFNAEDTRFSEDYGTKVDKEPTAENLALWIWRELESMFGTWTNLERITVWETDRCSATIRRS